MFVVGPTQFNVPSNICIPPTLMKFFIFRVYPEICALLGFTDKILLCVVELKVITAPDKTFNEMGTSPTLFTKSIKGILSGC
jgi:hypothetical protein